MEISGPCGFCFCHYRSIRHQYCSGCRQYNGCRPSCFLYFCVSSFSFFTNAKILPAHSRDVSKSQTVNCIAHPLEKHTARNNEFTDYAAAVNLLLTYYKLMDEEVYKRQCLS